MSLKRKVRITSEHGSDGTHTSHVVLAVSDIPVGAQAVDTQNVVTGSRALTTVYQNATEKPMFIHVSGYSNSLGALMYGYTDSAATPTTVVAYHEQGRAGAVISLFFIVLPSNYYKVDFSTGTTTLNAWIEWY